MERVYAATSAKLFGLCLRILRDQGEAEDVLQEVYTQVWRRAGAFDAARGVSPITWLLALTRNRAIDRLRASKAHLAHPAAWLDTKADEAPLASTLLEQQDEARRLTRCLDDLQPQHAAAVRSAFFDGASYSQLADAAAVPLGTMKSWIRRSLQQLRACLEADGG